MAATAAVALEVVRVGGEFQVSSSPQVYLETPDVALAGDGDCVVVWVTFGQNGDYSKGILARRFSGQQGGGEFQVNVVTFLHQYYPRIDASPDGSFVVVWQNVTGDLQVRVVARQFDGNGAPTGGEIVLGVGKDGIKPVAIVDGEGEFVVVWPGSGGISARRMAASGSPVDVRFWSAPTRRASFKPWPSKGTARAGLPPSGAAFTLLGPTCRAGSAMPPTNAAGPSS